MFTKNLTAIEDQGRASYGNGYTLIIPASLDDEDPIIKATKVADERAFLISREAKIIGVAPSVANGPYKRLDLIIYVIGGALTAEEVRGRTGLSVYAYGDHQSPFSLFQSILQVELRSSAITAVINTLDEGLEALMSDRELNGDPEKDYSSYDRPLQFQRLERRSTMELQERTLIKNLSNPDLKCDLNDDHFWLTLSKLQRIQTNEPKQD